MIKGGKTTTGKQRYRCHNLACSSQSFLLDSASKGRFPQSKRQGVPLSLNGNGMRYTAHVLGISPTTVSEELKRGASFSPVNLP